VVRRNTRFELPANALDRIRAWATLWSCSGLEGRIVIEPSSRMYRSLGRCQPEQGRIRLASLLFEDDHKELLAEVLCHEVAHVAVFELHGRRVRPHGGEWKALMLRAGFEPRVRLPASDRLERELAPRRRTLWQHRCPICQASRDAGRPVRRWRCSVCLSAGLDGRLQITRMRAVGVSG